MTTRTRAKAGRADGRRPDQLRAITLTRRAMPFAEGSCLVRWGQTQVICTASVEEKVPPFLKGRGTGWVTAEYGMLPRSTQQRVERERGKVGGRTQEIQRLIGRSLRAVIDPVRLGERTVLIDCDVVQADGGTRCAAITGAYVALVEAVRGLQRAGMVTASPIRDAVAAVSVGIVRGVALTDLAYAEDSQADVDMNVVMTGHGEFVEVQGTAERRPFRSAELQTLLALAHGAVRRLLVAQRACLKS